MLKILFLLLVATAAAPALADTTAVYKATTGAEMTVEIASNGNTRATMNADGAYSLTVDGQDYFVLFTARGAVVDRFSDVGAVMADAMQKLMADKKMPPMRDAPSFDFVQGGQMTVNGRPGIVWSMKVGDALSPDSAVVMSADPDLAELGRVLARGFELSTAMLGRAMGGSNPMAGMARVLRTGAPLRFAGMELVSVAHTPIGADRFALPAQPETLDQVRTRFIANGGHIP